MNARPFNADIGATSNDRGEASQPIDPSAVFRRLQQGNRRTTSRGGMKWTTIAPVAVVALGVCALAYGVVESSHHTPSPTIQASAAPSAAQLPANVATPAAQAPVVAQAPAAPSVVTAPPAVTEAATPAHHRAPHAVIRSARAADARDQGTDASMNVPSSTAVNPPSAAVAPPAAEAPAPLEPVAPNPMTAQPAAPAPSVTPAPDVPAPVNPAPTLSTPATPPAPPQP